MNVTEKLLLVGFSLLMIVLFSLNFISGYRNWTFEKLRNKKLTWYWFRVFGINETKENFFIFQKYYSMLVIVIMILSLLLLLTR